MAEQILGFPSQNPTTTFCQAMWISSWVSQASIMPAARACKRSGCLGKLVCTLEPACKVSVLSKESWPYKRTDLTTRLSQYSWFWLGAAKNLHYIQKDLTSVDLTCGLNCTKWDNFNLFSINILGYRPARHRRTVDWRWPPSRTILCCRSRSWSFPMRLRRGLRRPRGTPPSRSAPPHAVPHCVVLMW